MPERPDSGSPRDGFVTIAVVDSMPEAAVLLATLAAYGIFALPRNRGHISAQPVLMVALGGIWITVPRSQQEDALALLAEIDTGWRRPPRAVARNAWLNAAVSIAMTFLLMVPPMPRVPGLYGWRHREPDPLPPAAPAG
jgi:hypothetical protein